MPLSKTRLRQLKQLANKKERMQMGVFVAEGPKTVGDLLATHQTTTVVATERWINACGQSMPPSAELITVGEEELRRLSFMQSPQSVFAVFRQKQCDISPQVADSELVLALDGIQDPGNLGTIVRIADWFGIGNIVCNIGTADIFNPKAVQATMGSMARVNVEYTDLARFLARLTPSTHVYGTLLDGDSIYSQTLCQHGVIIMGNEGNGISPEIRPYITTALCIPPFRCGSAGGAESLNVAIATAITCSEFRRRAF